MSDPEKHSLAHKISFITGSAEKFAEAQLIIPELSRINLDLPEIQEIDQRKIICAKLLSANQQGYQNIIVEDTGLYFSSLEYTLPGPLIKWFVKSIGNDGLKRIATDNNGSARAFALTTVGFLPGDGREAVYFEGRIDGTIVNPRGNGFGWDAIFQPDGKNQTLGEMSPAEKSAISHRGRAFRALQKHLSE